jgi:hypothetical protein
MSTYTRRSRITGTELTVGRSADVGMEPEATCVDGRLLLLDWWTICEAHGTLLSSATRALAIAASGLDFCEDCRVEQERKEGK